MTRDEAVKICIVAGWGAPDAPIDALVALGVLKLDEPQDASTKFVAVVTGIFRDTSTATSILGAITAAGLKIVEK